LLFCDPDDLDDADDLNCKMAVFNIPGNGILFVNASIDI
jgi:hypothetical protein